MREFLENLYGADLMFIEGFDDCIMGMDETQMRVAYSIPKCINKILTFTGIETESEASEFFYTKIFGAVHENIDIAPTFINYHEATKVAVWLN